MYRIAADGYKSKGKYSGTKMKYVKLTPAWRAKDAKRHCYRVYGVFPEEKGELLPVMVERP